MRFLFGVLQCCCQFIQHIALFCIRIRPIMYAWALATSVCPCMCVACVNSLLCITLSSSLGVIIFFFFLLFVVRLKLLWTLRWRITIIMIIIWRMAVGYTNTDVIYKWNGARQAVAIAEDMKLSQFDLVDCPAANLTDTITHNSIDDDSGRSAKSRETAGGIVSIRNGSTKARKTPTHYTCKNIYLIIIIIIAIMHQAVFAALCYCRLHSYLRGRPQRIELSVGHTHAFHPKRTANLKPNISFMRRILFHKESIMNEAGHGWYRGENNTAQQ